MIAIQEEEEEEEDMSRCNGSNVKEDKISQMHILHAVESSLSATHEAFMLYFLS